jgi:hypothetical protein
MRLRGVFGIFALAMKRVLGAGRLDQAAFAVNQGNTNAQRSEIHSRHDGHQQALLSLP